MCLHISLNSYLREEPSVSELRYAIATRHSMRRRVPVHTRAVADFNFGAAPVGSESSVVHLMLENTGAVTTQWFVKQILSIMATPSSQGFLALYRIDLRSIETR